MPDSMSIDVDQQQQHRQSQRDPAQPSYVLRGHTAHIHSVQIVRRNTCLLTGDADGWLVCWTLDTKRPLAVWKAHDAAILGTTEWGPDKIITCVLLRMIHAPARPVADAHLLIGMDATMPCAYGN